MQMMKLLLIAVMLCCPVYMKSVSKSEDKRQAAILAGLTGSALAGLGAGSALTGEGTGPVFPEIDTNGMRERLKSVLGAVGGFFSSIFGGRHSIGTVIQTVNNPGTPSASTTSVPDLPCGENLDGECKTECDVGETIDLHNYLHCTLHTKVCCSDIEFTTTTQAAITRRG